MPEGCLVLMIQVGNGFDPIDVASRFPSDPSFYPSFLRVLSLPPTSYLVLSPSHTVLSLPPTWFFNQQPATPIFLIPSAVFLAFLLHFFTSPGPGTKPALWRSTMQFLNPRRQTPIKTHSKSLESLESPSVRTLRKTHLINRPRSEAEKTLSVPARMRDWGLIKESYGGHVHLHLIMTAGMSAVLGLVHTIFTTREY